jgi:hypothetical protein
MQTLVKGPINTGTIIVPTALLSSVCHPLLESKESPVMRRQSWVILKSIRDSGRRQIRIWASSSSY